MLIDKGEISCKREEGYLIGSKGKKKYLYHSLEFLSFSLITVKTLKNIYLLAIKENLFFYIYNIYFIL